MSDPFFFASKSQFRKDDSRRNIDLLNDETFGSGAVDDNWEDEHNQFVEQNSRGSSLSAVGRMEDYLDEDELELSNQQLAAAVEELVLNSDQDQDAIDPAIVSLRKESRMGSYDPRLTEDLISPYMGERNNFGRITPTYSSQNSSSSSASLFQTDGLRNIWSNTDLEVQDSLTKSPSMILERQMLNEKLKKMMTKTTSPEFEDEAILSAVKANPMPQSWPITSQSEDLLRHMFAQKQSMLRAEDLEREFSGSQLRGPSPTFGISIPKDNDLNHNGMDRSLPARSVSPIIGSPTSHALPIGTPPKHIADMMHQAHKQGLGGPHPGFPLLQRPQGFMVPPGRAVPPPPGMGPPRLWPPHGMINRPPMNPLVAQDIMNRIGINKPFAMMAGSPPTNMSPIGSPRFVQAPHLIPQPNIGFGQQHIIRPGQGPTRFQGPLQQMRQFPNQRYAGPQQRPMYLGPGHLHPEHSRFVRMRRQQSNRNRPYNGNHQHHGNHHDRRSHGRDSSSRDPYAYLMTSREKEWVIKIQMMALQSDRPEIDDYYYQRYIDKRLQEGKLSLDDDNPEQKRLITPTKANPEGKKYIPVQFDNSLGKLTVSSVYNPRQIIDVIHAEKEEENQTETFDVKMSMNKRLEIYKIIEKAYSSVMELEELNFNPEDLDDTENNEDAEKADNRSAKVYKSLEELLFFNESSSKEEKVVTLDIISQCLRIRKGKRLACRVLPLLTQVYAVKITQTIIKQLPVLIKRDQKEDILQEFYHPICHVLQSMDSDELLNTCSILTSICNVICRDKFGISIVCKILVIGDKIDELKDELQSKKIWNDFISSCFKAFFLLCDKKKSQIPNILEDELAIEAIAVLENHSQLINEGEKKRNKSIADLKEMLSFQIEGTAL
ncbi:protein PAT1 homolog 1-like [Styela clava]